MEKLNDLIGSGCSLPEIIAHLESVAARLRERPDVASNKNGLKDELAGLEADIAKLKALV